MPPAVRRRRRHDEAGAAASAQAFSPVREPYELCLLVALAATDWAGGGGTSTVTLKLPAARFPCASTAVHLHGFRHGVAAKTSVPLAGEQEGAIVPSTRSFAVAL